MMSPRPRISASVENTTDCPTRKSSGSFSGERATEMTGQGSLSRSAYLLCPFSVSSTTPRIWPEKRSHIASSEGAKYPPTSSSTSEVPAARASM